MIKWLRDKFASAISFFFILSVILVTVSGGIAGFAVGKSFGYYDNYSGIGCFIGLIIGYFFGNSIWNFNIRMFCNNNTYIRNAR